MENEDIAKAQECKLKGNDFFKKAQYLEAIEQYSSAISYDPSESSYFGNRAACYLARKKFNLCV
jgi:tetratricopeptide (TPR) repeat protein